MTLKEFYQFVRTHREALLEEQRVRLHCEAFSALGETIEDTFNTLVTWFVHRHHPNRVGVLTDETVRQRVVSRFVARLRWVEEPFRPRRKFSTRHRRATVYDAGPSITVETLNTW